MYTRQHKQYGLDPPYVGPFKILKRLSRSTVRIKVGTYKDGTVRTEDRFWGDCKAIKLPENTIEEERPKLGRKPNIPSTLTVPVSPPVTGQDHQTFTGFKPSEIPIRKNLLQDYDDNIKNTIASIDFSKPPPILQTWSASPEDIEVINASINRRIYG